VRSNRRRQLGVGLLAWGLVGVLLLATGVTIGMDIANRAEALISSSDQALVAAADSTRQAADALDGVGTGVGQAQASSLRAAALADNASATLEALASSMSLSIFGSQPFLPLAADFTDSAAEAAALADELEAMGGTLQATSGDTGLLASELRELAAVLDDSTESAPAPPLRIGLLVMLVWIALPTIGALVVGAQLARNRLTA
jgi:hypothetical protein